MVVIFERAEIICRGQVIFVGTRQECRDLYWDIYQRLRDFTRLTTKEEE